MLPLVVGSNVGHSLHDLSRIEETNKTFFLFSLALSNAANCKCTAANFFQVHLMHDFAELFGVKAPNFRTFSLEFG